MDVLDTVARRRVERAVAVTRRTKRGYKQRGKLFLAGCGLPHVPEVLVPVKPARVIPKESSAFLGLEIGRPSASQFGGRSGGKVGPGGRERRNGGGQIKADRHKHKQLTSRSSVGREIGQREQKGHVRTIGVAAVGEADDELV